MANQTSGSHIKALNILHKALISGQVVFGAIASYLVYANLFVSNQKNLEKPLQLIAVLLSVGGFIVGNLIFKNRINNVIGTKESIVTKMEVYRTACLVQWALIELGCLFSIISFMLTGDYSFLFLAGALVLTFAMLSPAKDKIVFQLQLTDEEAAQL